MTEVITAPQTGITAPNFGLTKFLDPLRVPPVLRPHLWWKQEDLTVTMRRTRVRLHSQLPETEVWAYDGQFPGPTIEVRGGKRLRVNWANEIEGRMPLVAVQGPIAQAPGNVPGGYRDADGNLLPGFEIIDGVAELPVLEGLSQLTEYPNGQEATTLWYTPDWPECTCRTATAKSR
ncbi:multicopper oxidase domain-containing protein [Amycolatopsis acidicola]|uniref:multicopper oxidase domain-containing protein n=1 Tax=Amycolatopsis acidicola TaxID=2596893 RepID=UPI001FB78B8D|nr:multicopper oxidase domain-containing protein [Amycolatopsis acidicola]